MHYTCFEFLSPCTLLLRTYEWKFLNSSSVLLLLSIPETLFKDGGTGCSRKKYCRKDNLISYGKREHKSVKRMNRFCNKEMQKTYFSYIGKTYNSDIQNSARVPAEKNT